MRIAPKGRSLQGARGSGVMAEQARIDLPASRAERHVRPDARKPRFRPTTSSRPRSITTGCAPSGKIKVSATKPMVTQRDLALAYSPGVAYACEAIVADPERRQRADRARQPGRGDHQRHRGARPRRHRPARRQAGDGRQGRAVPEVRRHRRVRHRDRRARPRQAGRHHRLAGADLRRHQPRGHQGAGMLHRRAQAARADEHPGVPRRPARHRDHRRRRRAQRAGSRRQEDRGREARHRRRRRGRHRLPRHAGGAGHEARKHPRGRPRRRAVHRPRQDGPGQAALRARHRQAHARARSSTAPTSSSACPPAAC